MYFLECTSWSDENPQGYDDVPRFRKHIWPLLMEGNVQAIETIYVFRPYEEEPVMYEKDSFAGYGYSAEMEHKSYYGGHLDIFYKTRDRAFISKLVNLWLRPCTLENSEEKLSIKEIKLKFLERTIKEMGKEFVLFGFGHDADPLYLFGEKSLLTAIAEEKQRGQ